MISYNYNPKFYLYIRYYSNFLISIESILTSNLHNFQLWYQMISCHKNLHISYPNYPINSNSFHLLNESKSTQLYFLRTLISYLIYKCCLHLWRIKFGFTHLHMWLELLVMQHVVSILSFISFLYALNVYPVKYNLIYTTQSV